LAEVKNTGALTVPLHLRNAPTGLAKALGHGKEYQYPHDHPDHIVRQDYLPEGMQQREFYHPTDIANEKTIKDRMAWWERRLAERK